MYSLPAYAFIAQDFTTQAALYTHHQYIAGFIMTGAFAHGAIFFIRDYNPEQNEDNVLARMLDHKEAIISHLSWASLFLGFHTLGLYVHNDVMLAFGTPEKQILIEPIFAQWIQSAHGKTSYGFGALDSHQCLRYSSRHSRFRFVHRRSRGGFPLRRNAPLPMYFYIPQLRQIA
ncbi:hypothetical protein CASFOL_007690 [Castilleja foliolosa]|uniref:Photosystem I P700 apoprotein A2 n=1 Tax=Castilleja foliolosa TaxID=1961234 RepID=A0ABD3E5B8_9LAMI